MQGTAIVFRRELHSFFHSPLAVVVMTAFLLMAGYFFMNYLVTYNIVLDRFLAGVLQTPSGAAPPIEEWVTGNYLQTILALMLFVVPFLTMRSVAEERQNGTLELLLTLPLGDTAIVLGKFLALSTVAVLMLVVAFSLPLGLCGFAGAGWIITMAGAAGVIMATVAFLAIGLGVSAAVRSQLLAGIVTFAILLFLYVSHVQSETLPGAWARLLSYLSPVTQTRDWFEGVLSSRTIIYFLSVILTGVYSAKLLISVQRRGG